MPKFVALIFFLAMYFLTMSGCATTEVTKVWHVNPADTARFNDDSLKCQRFAIGSRYAEQLFDSCLRTAGYRLEIVTSN